MKKIIFLCMVILVVISIQGCDQLRSKLAEAINPKTPQQVLESARKKVKSEKYQEALNELESHPTSDPEMVGKFAWVAAQSSFQLGQLEKGYDYLIKAMHMKAATVEDAMAEPLFETVRTELRFNTVLTGPRTNDVSSNVKEVTAPKEKSEPSVVKNDTPATKSGTTVVRAGADASVTVDANGRTEVKAGDASAKLP